MQALRIWSRRLSAAVCLCGTIALAQEAPQAPANAVPALPVQVQVLPPRAVVVDRVHESEVEVLLADQDAPFGAGAFLAFADPGSAQAESGKYWVGLLCVDAGEAMRQQLGLDAGVGLLVENVTDEAPAKKAGIQKHDVLLAVALPSDDPKAEPKPLKEVLQLVVAVQQSETRPLKLIVLRRGQKQTIEVTPAERPQAPATVQIQRFGPAEKQLEALLQAQRKQAEAQADQAGKEADRAREAVKAIEKKLHEQHLGLRLAGPMFVHTPQAPKLPEGMSLEFRQVVGQPERMLVNKGDQKWEMTAEELGKLPADVRGPVEQQIAFRRGMLASFGPGMAAPPMMGIGAGMAAHHMAGGAGMGGMSGMAGGGAVIGVMSGSPPATMSRFTGAIETKSMYRFPDEVIVTIVRKGGEPAQITVKKKDQSWEITEKELDKLPEDVRPRLVSLLAEPSVTVTAVPLGNHGWSAKTLGTVPFDPRFPEQPEAMRRQSEAWQKMATPDAARQLLERQEAMLKHLQQLTEKVEKLQQALEKSTPKP